MSEQTSVRSGVRGVGGSPVSPASSVLPPSGAGPRGGAGPRDGAGLRDDRGALRGVGGALRGGGAGRRSGAGFTADRRRPPTVVRAATVAWVTAVGAGAVEAVGMAVAWVLGEVPGLSGGALAAGLGMRAVIYTVVLLVVSRFWQGRNWARVTLAVGLGVVGMLSLVMEPISWLAEGHSLADALSSASVGLALTIAIRALHVAAVLVGCALMFRPEANRYFRRVASS